MTHTLNVQVDMDQVHADVCQFMLRNDFASGEDIWIACNLPDFEGDVQLLLLYKLMIAAHARIVVNQGGPDCSLYPATIKAAHYNGGEPYAEVEFKTKDIAMLWKLSQP